MGIEIFKRPLSFFWELVDRAWRHQRLREDLVCEEYLALLLERFLSQERSAVLDESLLKKLYESASQEAARYNLAEIRDIGDASLFMAGMFSQKLSRRSAGVRHYIDVGEAAYQILLMRIGPQNTLSVVYQKLSRDLVPFVRVLSEINRECLAAQPGVKDILTV